MIRGLLSLLLIFQLLMPGLSPVSKSYSATRFDVDVEIMSNGSLRVTETIQFDFVGGPFTYVFREIPKRKTDGVNIVQASIDGRILSSGIDAGQVEVVDKDPVEVTWHFAPTSDSSHTFEVTYEVYGVLQQTPESDLLLWTALPEEHEYTIETSRVRITYPTGTRLVSSPEIRKGKATTESGSSSVTFTAGNIEEDETFLIGLHFVPGSLITEMPEWQQAAQQNNQQVQILMPLAGVLTVLGVFLALRLKRRYRKPIPQNIASVNRLPNENIPPALAGFLIYEGHTTGYGWDMPLGTLFDLAKRDIITVEEVDAKSWFQKTEYHLHLNKDPHSLKLQNHERVLIEALFNNKGTFTSSTTMTEVQNNIYELVTQFSQALELDAAAMGYIDEDQKKGQNAFMNWGAILMVSSLVLGLLILFLAVKQIVGFWILLLAGSILLTGIAFMITSATISPLSEKGCNEAAMWQGFRRYLRDITRGQDVLIQAHLGIDYLGYVASMGYIQRWAHYLKKQEDIEIPQWFRNISTAHTNNTAAFTGMIVAVHASGSSGAASSSGVAAGGAAGGGASGAG